MLRLCRARSGHFFNSYYPHFVNIWKFLDAIIAAMSRVLIVEDDKGIVEGITASLTQWDMEASSINDFRNVIEEFKDFSPHLVLLDISLPYMGGYHWCQEIRKISSVPIIFISSATDNMNIIMAVNMGGDDFIPKPFDPSVLVAKIQALLRRTYHFNNSALTMEACGAKLNTENNTITYMDKKRELSRNEYIILLTLIQNKNKIVSRERLMESLWETDSFIDENTLTVNIARLRKTLESIGLKDIIKTKFGVGYILEDS